MTRRVVRLLEPLDPKRRAQRKYRAKPASKAKQASYWAQWYAKPENRAKVIARATKWAQDNRTQRRVYNRIWTRTKRRIEQQQAA